MDDHFVARITAAPKVYKGVCTCRYRLRKNFHRRISIIPAARAAEAWWRWMPITGAQVWKTYVVPTPEPTRKNSKGVQQYAPSGGSIWNSPTIDAKRNALYVGTGDGQNRAGPADDRRHDGAGPEDRKGAVVLPGAGWRRVHGRMQRGAANRQLPSGKWPRSGHRQFTHPAQVSSGKSVVVFGMKNGKVFALDPDKNGAVVWKTQVVDIPKSEEHSFFANLNGVVWGGTADDQNVYYGLQSGGMVALKLATGDVVWRATFPKLQGARVINSAAATGMPGVAFVAGSDGKIHAVSTADGHSLWEYDTAREFKTVNDVPAKGGAINSIGPSIADGMLFIGSGYAVTGTNSGNVLLAFSAQ